MHSFWTVASSKTAAGGSAGIDTYTIELGIVEAVAINIRYRKCTAEI